MDTVKKQSRKPRQNKPVTVIVEREFVGRKTISEAMIPIILEELLRKGQSRTFDNTPDPD